MAKKWLEILRDKIRMKHYSIGTGRTYLYGVKVIFYIITKILKRDRFVFIEDFYNTYFSNCIVYFLNIISLTFLSFE